MDRVATRYRVRPSELLAINDPWVALDLDLAVFARGASEDLKLEKEAAKGGSGTTHRAGSLKEFAGRIKAMKRQTG